MKHTKGPWFFEDDKHNTHKWVFSQATGYVIARFEHDEINLEANAHLIAAAPDMLEALEQTLDVFNKTDIDEIQAIAMVDKLFQVIKKARGES